MLIDFIGRNRHLLLKYHYIVKITIILLTPFTLLGFKRDYNLRAFDTMYGNIDPLFNLKLSKPTDFKPMSPGMTICIIMERWDQALVDSINCLRLRTKSIVITDKDIPEIYFVKLKIKFRKNSHVVVHPLRNFQPNSDLLSLAVKIFTAKCCVNIEDLLFGYFDSSVELHLDNSPESITKLLVLLKYYMNVEAFTWCNFYYVPFNNYFIRGESLCYFIVAVIVSSVHCSAFSISLARFLFSIVVFLLCPILSILLYDIRLCTLPMILYAVLNFKIAFLFSLFIYIQMISSLLLDVVRLGLGRRPISGGIMKTIKMNK